MKQKAIRFKRTLVLLLKLNIMLISVVGFYLVFFAFYKEAHFYFKGNVLFISVYIVLLYFFLHTYNAFRFGSFRYRDLVFAYMVGTFLTNVVAYCLLSLFALKLLTPFPLLFLTIALWILSVPGYRLEQRAYYVLFPTMPALAVCGSAYDHETIRKFRRENTRFVVKEVCDELLGVEVIMAKARQYRALVVGYVSRDLQERLLEESYLHHKKLIRISSLHDVIASSATPLIINDSLVYICKGHQLSMDQRFLKRTIDLFIASISAILMSPFMLVSAILIKAYDKGPILLRQTRLTRDGRPFTLYKFRSMIVDAEKDTGAVLSPGKTDQRITPIGRFLRSSHFDELPQLYNVLIGDMTMVGPRPERPELYETIESGFPQFKYRLAVKAGLTGYAQLYGRYDTSFDDKARLDIYYIENATILLDLQLMVYTLKDILWKQKVNEIEAARPVIMEMDPGMPKPDDVNDDASVQKESA